MTLPTIMQDLSMPIAPHVADAVEAASSALAKFVRARGLPREGEWAVLAVGSSARYRAWGLWGTNAHRRLPITVRLRVVARGEAGDELVVQLRNDDHFYAVRLPQVEPAYRRAYSDIVQHLEFTCGRMAR